MALDLWVGTSGYVYPEWVGGLYPPGTSSRAMLARYAEHFPLVELNFTFYRPPAARDLEGMVRRTPDGFQFIVKLHQSFSHDQDLSGAASFRAAVEPMRRAGRLLALLCQYPQRFHDGRPNRERLRALAGEFAGYPLAVEFRHRSWDRPEVPAWLQGLGLHLVSVDVPDLPSLYPSGLVQSGRWIYVRLHSRRASSWHESGEERYNYLYRDEELRGWVDALAARADRADRALVLFNNCRFGHAAQNALRVGDLVREASASLRLVPPFQSAGQDRQGLLF